MHATQGRHILYVYRYIRYICTHIYNIGVYRYRCTLQAHDWRVSSRTSGLSLIPPAKQGFIFTSQSVRSYLFRLPFSRGNRALRRTYPGWEGDYGLASERAQGTWLPLNTPLGEMDPTLLQSCDVVMLLPYTPPAVEEEGEGMMIGDGPSEGPSVGPSEGQTSGADAAPSEGDSSSQACDEKGTADDGPLKGPSEGPLKDPSEGPPSEEVVVSVVAGKTAHSIAFSKTEWEGGATVGDLKVRPSI